MSPDEVRHWCDNKGAVDATNKTSIHTPGDMLAPDADIILANLHHKQTTKIASKCIHVLSHQDTKERKTKEEKEQDKKDKQRELRARIREVDAGEGTHAPSPEPSPPPSPFSDTSEPHKNPHLKLPRQELSKKDLSDEVLMNVACDEYAGKAAREHMECPEVPAHDILQPPYKGSKAMLKIGDLWITSDYDDNIHFASTAPALRKYCHKRHKWDKKTMELIWSNFVRSMKLLHGWLPIMHNLGKYKHITQCPGCECPDETFLQLFNCLHHLMTEALEDALEKIDDICHSTTIADSFSRALLSCINCGTTQTAAPVPNHPHELATAVKHQNRIGTHKMLQGYLAKSWGEALRATGYKGNHRLGLARLHRILWEQLFQRIWDTQNYILKKTPHRYNTTEEATLEQKLNWYRKNRHTVLSLHDRHLANIDSDKIKKMG
jgi:hypothetical protein